MYSIDIRLSLKKKFAKIAKRNPKQAEVIARKVKQILSNPHHYKNLKTPLQKWKRVHIDKHFVLTFSINENTKTVILEDYEHHDNIYKS